MTRQPRVSASTILARSSLSSSRTMRGSDRWGLTASSSRANCYVYHHSKQIYYIDIALAKSSGEVVEMKPLIDFSVLASSGDGDSDTLSLAEELRRERMRCVCVVLSLHLSCSANNPGAAWKELHLRHCHLRVVRDDGSNSACQG